jgi:hypothetical protein
MCGYLGNTGSYGESPPWIGMPVVAAKNLINLVAFQSFALPNPTS